MNERIIDQIQTRHTRDETSGENRTIFFASRHILYNSVIARGFLCVLTLPSEPPLPRIRLVGRHVFSKELHRPLRFIMWDININKAIFEGEETRVAKTAE